MEPLAPDVVDELLSAELDGAFDAAARDLGYEPAIARARLDASPDVDARRAAFAATRRALAVAPLDPDRRAAMVTAAAAVRQRARAPRVARALAAAAAIVLVVGIGVSIAGRDSDREQSNETADSEALDEGGATATPPPSAVTPESSAAAPTTLDPQPNADEGASSQDFLPESRLRAVDFGDIADADALRRVVEREIGGATEGTDDALQLPFEARLEPCVAQQATRLDVDPGLVAYGPARYRGEPTEVLVYRRGADHVVVIVSEPRDACRLVDSLVVRTDR